MAKAQRKVEAFEAAGEVEADGSPGFIRIKNRNYAIGLQWFQVDTRSSAVAEARAMAARPGFDCDLYCVRRNATQFGLGRKSEGHAAGMVSLGGALADERGGNWVGLFEVAGGFYLIAVANDEVQTGSDRFFANEMTAREKFEDILTYLDGAEAIAPASFGMPSAAAITIEDILGNAKSPKLAATDRVGGIIRYAAIGGVLVLAIGGYIAYQNYLSEIEYQAELARLQQEALDRTGMGAPKVVVPPMPWVGKAEGVAFIKACDAGLDKSIMSFPGWDVIGLACDGTAKQAVLGLQRSKSVADAGGSINWIRWTLDRYGLKDAVASPVGDGAAEVRWSLGDLPNHPVQIATPKIPDSRRYLQSWFEETMTPIAFGAMEGGDFFQTLKFSFVTPYNPSTFDEILAKIPGLTIDRIDLDAKSLTYTVNASVYEELPLPQQVGPNGVGGPPPPGPVAAATQ